MTAGWLAAEPIVVRFPPVRAWTADSAILARREAPLLRPRLRVHPRALFPRPRHRAVTAAVVAVVAGQCRDARNAEIYTDKQMRDGSSVCSTRPSFVMSVFDRGRERIIQPLAYARGTEAVIASFFYPHLSSALLSFDLLSADLLSVGLLSFDRQA